MSEKRVISFVAFTVMIFLAPLTALALELSVHDIINRKKELSPEKLEQLQWLPNSHLFSYIDKDQGLVVTDVDSKEIKHIPLQHLNAMFDANLENFPELSFIDRNRFWLKQGPQVFIYDIEADKIIPTNSLPDDAENLVIFSPEKIAYTSGPNLFIALNNQIIKLTDFRPTQNILNGHVVHRSEFGIRQGSFWSKSGKLLAYYRMNESMVDDYPFKDIRSSPVKYQTMKYPMAGTKSHQVTLHIYNLETNEEVILETGAPADQYLTGVSFAPDDKNIFVNILNRAQNHLKTVMFATGTGKMNEILWEHQTEKYLNPTFAYYFSTKRPHHPLWCSAHLGWSQLFELNVEAKTLAQKTSAAKDIDTCVGFCAAQDKFFYTAFDDNYPSRHGYVYDVAREEEIKLTHGQEGQHTIKPSDDGAYILDIFSSDKIGYQVDLLNDKGVVLNTVFKAPNPLANYAKVEIQMVKLRSADDKYDLFGRMILPANFNKQQHYPAIVYVYGGPNIQVVQNTWLLGARLWEIMMAQKGYIVFSLDNRGSGNRGMSFEQETFRALGTVELLDQIKGVEFLRNLKFVDMNRLGIYGWSFGGFMSTSLMVKYPDIFKVGIAGGAVTDWRSYEIMYTERYMGLPEENIKGYAESNLLNFAEQLKGRFMMISGTHDDVVVPSHTELFIDKAIDSGKKIDSFYYPYGKHHFNKNGELHLHEKITNYFEENL